MSNSLISSLTGLLDRHAVSNIASRIGASEDSVSTGLGPTFATILSGMGHKTNDPTAMRQIYDLTTAAPSDSINMAHIGNLASESAATSPLADAGRRLLPMLFGRNQTTVSEAIGRSSGLTGGAAERLLGIAAPMVLAFLGNRVRDEGMGLSGFTSFLQRETTGLGSYLPSGLSHLWTTTKEPVSRAAMVGHHETHKRSSWVLPTILALAACLALLWFVRRGTRDAHRAADVVTESATRGRTGVLGLGDMVTRQLPGDIHLRIPENGVEARLVDYIQSGKSGTDTWFDFDRINFATSSATLSADSQEQLRNIASIMKAYPNVRLKIGGYTDNVGDPSSNMNLSQDRANSVRQDLINLGVSSERLEAEGYGEQFPIGDNSTEEGRARNRRISMRVL